MAYNITIGSSWFEGFNSFPGVQWVYSLPLVYLNQANSIEATKMAVSMIGSKNLYALEMGNEPDLYPANGRPRIMHLSVWSSIRRFMNMYPFHLGKSFRQGL